MTATTLPNAGLRLYVTKCLNTTCDLPSQLSNLPAVIDRDHFRRRGQFEIINNVKYRRETDAVKSTESRRAGSSKILYSPVFFERETIASIRALPAHQQCWLNFCYVDKSLNIDEIQTCVDKLMPKVIERLMLKTQGRGSISSDALVKISNVFLLAAGEARYQLNHFGRRYNSVSQIQMITGISARSWRNKWCQRWRVFLSIWYEHDDLSLTTLDYLLDEIESLYDHDYQ